MIIQQRHLEEEGSLWVSTENVACYSKITVSLINDSVIVFNLPHVNLPHRLTVTFFFFFFAGREAATETGDVKLLKGSPKEMVETSSGYVIRRDERD